MMSINDEVNHQSIIYLFEIIDIFIYQVLCNVSHGCGN